MRIPSGQNAQSVAWTVDGEVIGSAELVDRTPAEQVASIDVTGLAPGWHELGCALTNQHGTTDCKAIKVRVKG